MIVNRDPKARGPFTAFAEVAGAYERGRPSYPEDAVRWLAGDEPCDIVDLGAGTGKLTRALVALGHRVTAVEPLAEMRAQLESAVPGVAAVSGNAESMPLEDASADVVTCAQAFHWFDHAVALPEIARILRPGGRLALVWNTRDDRDTWVAELSEISRERVDRRERRRGPDPAERALRHRREDRVPLRAGARPGDAARPRALAELLREAPAGGPQADPRGGG